MNLLLTPPFDSPIAPAALPPGEFTDILAEHGIKVVANPAKADLELAGIGASLDASLLRLPPKRVVIIDGEPPQPEYLLPHYVQSGYAAVLTPANLEVYDSDCMAFYTPPLEKRPTPGRRNGKICQLATYRSQPGNCNDGTHIAVMLNGHLWSWRVLCVERVRLGLAIRNRAPDLIDIYGRGWPMAVAGNTRNRVDFVADRLRIASQYRFDLCWENTSIPGYVTEKFWGAVRAGCLPIYRGPEGLFPGHSLPWGCLLESTGGAGLLVERIDILDDEDFYGHTVGLLLDWYYALPRDSALQSWRKSAHRLAKRLLEVRGVV